MPSYFYLHSVNWCSNLSDDFHSISTTHYLIKGGLMDKEKYNLVKIKGQLALLTYGRLYDKDINKKLFTYDIQSSDDGFDPAAIRKSILVNHWGSLITHEPFHLDESGWLFVDGYNELETVHSIRLTQDEFESLSEQQRLNLIEHGTTEDIKHDFSQLQI